jgi:hypothetical protein
MVVNASLLGIVLVFVNAKFDAINPRFDNLRG